MRFSDGSLLVMKDSTRLQDGYLPAVMISSTVILDWCYSPMRSSKSPWVRLGGRNSDESGLSNEFRNSLFPSTIRGRTASTWRFNHRHGCCDLDPMLYPESSACASTDEASVEGKRSHDLHRARPVCRHQSHSLAGLDYVSVEADRWWLPSQS